MTADAARLTPAQEIAFAQAMRDELRLPMIRTQQVRPAPVVQPPLTPNYIELGRAEDTGAPVGLDPSRLIDGRLLIQGSSGAGKSWTLRRLLEQTADRIQQIVIDPEGDLASLAERFQHTVINAARLDPAALAEAANRIRRHRLSVILDLSDMEREAQMQAVAAFLDALIAAPRDLWTPALVAIDEAHLFAPFGVQSGESAIVRKASVAAVTDLMSRGRKRGLAGVLATQRLARLSKSVLSEIQSLLIGLNSLDLDIRRAAETIGWDARRAYNRLPTLSPGEFVAVGPAFSRSPVVTCIGAVASTHRGATPKLFPLASVSPDEAVRLLDVEALARDSDRDRAERAVALSPTFRAVRAFIRDPAFPLAGRVLDALRPLAPEGALTSDLAAHLCVDASALGAALALLDLHGVLEFTGEGANRAVRLEESFQ